MLDNDIRIIIYIIILAVSSFSLGITDYKKDKLLYLTHIFLTLLTTYLIISLFYSISSECIDTTNTILEVEVL